MRKIALGSTKIDQLDSKKINRKTNLRQKIYIFNM